MPRVPLPTQVHRFALDAGLNVAFSLSGVRAVVVQFLNAAGKVTAPQSEVSLSLDHGAPLLTKQETVRFLELTGGEQLLLQAPPLGGRFVRVVLAASPALVELV